MSAAGAEPGLETDLPRFVGDFIADGGRSLPFPPLTGAAPVLLSSSSALSVFFCLLGRWLVLLCVQ